MARYFAIRVAESLIAIWGVLTIVFAAARLTGDPAVLMLPVGASLQQLQDFRREAGLDRPILEQYLSFLSHAIRGDFGESLLHHQPAFNVVIERMPATIQLAVTALTFGILLGGVMGFVAARKRGTFVEFCAMTIALLGQAMPVFWLGIMLVIVFSVQLGWLPTGGRSGFVSLILPAFTLAVFTSASVARLLRSSMIEVLQQDYVRTARAKGMFQRTIYLRHVMRNALIPVVTMIGILTGELLGGAVLIETIYAWPGVGSAILLAIESKDFTVVQAAVAIISTTFILVNLGVDLLYGVLDPRIRIAK